MLPARGFGPFESQETVQTSRDHIRESLLYRNIDRLRTAAESIRVSRSKSPGSK